MGRPSKHNVDPNPEKRTYDGTVYDSVMEMRFYVEWLTPKVESGEISKCEKQVPFVLQDAFEYNGKHIREISYVADFVCTYSNGQTLVIDTKGFPDAACLLKRKMFWHRYPEIEYIWMTYSACDGGWVLFEELKKLRKKRKEDKIKKEVKDRIEREKEKNREKINKERREARAKAKEKEEKRKAKELAKKEREAEKLKCRMKVGG